MSIYFAVEDQLSGSVAERLIYECFEGDVATMQLGKSVGGFGFIKKNLKKYVDLSRREYVVILTDLDLGECAPSLRAEWLRDQKIKEPMPRRMAFCIAVREVETWLLSDRKNFARFLGVNPSRIDRNVEQNVVDPKEYLINLARRATNREIKFDLLPAPRSEASIGMAYNYRLSKFARELWNPDDAADTCTSLRRAMERIREFKQIDQGQDS